MTLSMDEFSLQEADLLPTREALQSGMWTMLGGLFGAALGYGPTAHQVPAQQVPGYQVPGYQVPAHGAYQPQPGQLMHVGPRPMPAIR